MAVKWSLLTELAARLITPITQLVLARILTPDAFGFIATIVMVTSFADMLSDAGFQKYLVQHNFRSKIDLHRTANVAFWCSSLLSITSLAIIVAFRDLIATLVGSPGLGSPLAIASLSLPITVLSSTQAALFRRAFEFKRLLPVRLAAAFVSFSTAVPLALLGFDYWSLIVGTLASSALTAAWLTILSEWKPRLQFSFSLLRRMFAFSGWSLLEAISIWLTAWSGTFIVASLLTTHELGLFRQPITLINSIFALVTSATTPVLFAALSRLQSDMPEFRQVFLRFQLFVGAAVLPIGVLMLFYREIVTFVLLGPQWMEASLLVGLWGFSSGIMIIFSHYCSEVYRALGKPKISMIAQTSYMIFMVPSLYFAAQEGFDVLVVVATSIRLVLLIINQCLTGWLSGIYFWQVLSNQFPALVSTGAMAVFIILLPTRFREGVLPSIATSVCALILYCGTLLIFTDIRTPLVTEIRKRRSRKYSPNKNTGLRKGGS